MDREEGLEFCCGYFSDGGQLLSLQFGYYHILETALNIQIYEHEISAFASLNLSNTGFLSAFALSSPSSPCISVMKCDLTISDSASRAEEICYFFLRSGYQF